METINTTDNLPTVRTKLNSNFTELDTKDTLSAADGSAAAPSVSFTNDPNTGVYRVGADQVGLSAGGSLRATARSDGFRVASGGTLQLPDGAVGSPAAQFTNDPDTGIYRHADNGLSIATGGSQKLRIGSQVAHMAEAGLQDGNTSLPGLYFVNDTDTGMYRQGSNIISFLTGGSRRVTIADAEPWLRVDEGGVLYGVHHDGNQPSRWDFVTTGTSNLYSGQWTRVARVQIDAQYQDVNALWALLVTSHSTGWSYNGFLRLRVKQQAAFGSNPGYDFAIDMLSGEGNPLQCRATIVQNTPTTIVDFYLQVNLTYTNVRATTLAAYVGSSSTLTSFTGESFTTSTPSLAGTSYRLSAYEGAWNPSWTGVTLGTGSSAVARWHRQGNLVHVMLELTLGTGGGITGDIVCTNLPFTSDGDWNVPIAGNARLEDTSAGQRYDGVVAIGDNSTSAYIRAKTSSGTYLLQTNCSSTIPFSWTSGDIIRATFTYKTSDG